MVIVTFLKLKELYSRKGAEWVWETVQLIDAEYMVYHYQL